MGNIHSENQICDCAPPSTRTTGLGGGKGRHGLLTDKLTFSAERKGARPGRVRSVSLGEGESMVDFVERKSVTEIGHRYNLRPRKKDGSKTNGLDQLKNATTVPATPNSEKGSRPRYSSADNELLLLSLEKLSLVDISTNQIDDKEQVVEEDLELPKNVLYYGWFFSPEVSSVIHKTVMHLFQLCYDEVPNFQRFISTCCKDADIRDHLEYYKRPGKKVKPDDPIEYHITAKFLARDPNPPYQTLVHPFLQKTFHIHLIGLVFTPRTLGVRVKLSPAQQLIFDEKDESNNRTGRKLSDSANNSQTTTHIRKQIQDEIDGYSYSHKIHKKANPNCKLKMKDGIAFKRCKKQNSSATSDPPTSRAHITIGCARHVKPKQTGDDLVDVIDLEQRSASTTSNANFQQDFKMERGVLRQFGKHADAFVFYSDTEMIVPGHFNLFI